MARVFMMVMGLILLADVAAAAPVTSQSEVTNAPVVTREIARRRRRHRHRRHHHRRHRRHHRRHW